MTLRSDLDELAGELVKQAQADTVTLDEKRETFKILCGFYALQLRSKRGNLDEEADDKTFADFTQSIREINGPISNRRGS